MFIENKISVIIPAFNVEKTIVRCLDSIIGQSYYNLEIIVVDDGSNDNTYQIIESYKKIDERIITIHNKKNLGLFVTRFIGAKKATGKYVAFVDSDDYLSRDFYRLLINKAEKYDADITISNTIYENDNGQYCKKLHELCFDFNYLKNDSIIDSFFNLEGQCFSWHTIWNKLYKKELFDKCLPYFKKLNKHIVMIEDIAFSTLFFSFANKITCENEALYFYCQNSKSVTNIKKDDYFIYIKNVEDIKNVFEFVEQFLIKNNLDKNNLEHFNEIKKYYVRLWRTNALKLFTGKKLENILAILNKVVPNYNELSKKEDSFFDKLSSRFDDRFENIKNVIIDSKDEFISFDIFDTLIARPFLNPKDLFNLLDKKYEHLISSSLNFRKIREYSEVLCRKKFSNFEDVNIDEIYQVMGETFHLNQKIISTMKEEEKRLELQFCYPRQSGKSLFELAKYCNKKIILVTDMYLNFDTIEKILKKCGYIGYYKLFVSSEIRETKATGNLYDYVKQKLNLNKGIIHIGDNWKSDVENSSLAGFVPVFLPNKKEVMDNKIQGIQTNDCSHLAYKVVGISGEDKLLQSLGYRTMLGKVSSFYFDNPYRDFNSVSDLNGDPKLIGYYCLGMHLLSIVDSLKQKARSYDKICFLARDGKLIMDAYDIARKYDKTLPKSEYVMSSRNLLMPYIINGRQELFNLPIDFHCHCPKSILKILDFCSKKINENKLKENGFLLNRKFVSEEEYLTFIKYFSDNLYDSLKHQNEKNNVSRYYKEIVGFKKVLFVDLGYSGRIPFGISKALDSHVDIYYIYSAYDEIEKYRRNSEFDVTCLYPSEAEISGAIRELLISDTKPSCIRVKYVNNKKMFVFEDKEYNNIQKFIIEKIHKYALTFVDEWFNSFNDYIYYLSFKDYEISLPFEAFIKNPKLNDISLFKPFDFEDKVYGGQDSLSIYEFWKQITVNTRNNEITHTYSALPYDIYPNGIYVRTYRLLEKTFPLGKKRRKVVKDIANIILKIFKF